MSSQAVADFALPATSGATFNLSSRTRQISKERHALTQSTSSK